MKKQLVVGILLLSGFASSALGQSKDAFVGTWRLVSSTERNERGDVKDSFGKHPNGLITYTADGRMMAIIAFDGRKALSVADYVAAPAAERAEAFATFLSYAGTYTVKGNKVIHHVEVAWLQNRVGTDQVREFAFRDDGRLVLRTPPILKGGATITAELVWERIPAK